MLRWMLWVFAGILALFAGITIAFATTSSVSSQSVVSGSGSVTGCDATPAWSYTFLKNSGGQVSAVQITNIAATCSGGAMQMTLAGSLLSSTGTPTAITSCIGRCSVTVPFTTTLLFPSQISSANALIVGP